MALKNIFKKQQAQAPEVAEFTPGENITPQDPQTAAMNEQEAQEAGSFLYEIASVMVTSFVLIAIIFTFFFRLVGVNGDSMLNTLQSGNWLIVRTFYSHPQYKDIIISTQPNELEKTLVKRVIAVSGQKVDIDFVKGIVYVDDKPLDEPYTKTATNLHDSDTLDFPLTVPEGFVFVMGDNRNNSYDSRTKKIGLIANEYLLGKAVGRIIPFGGWDIYKNSK